MDTAKTPMDSILQKLAGLSSGHEKALKQGIYNAVALLLLCIVCSAGYGLYIVLGPFLKPLIWALLCGAVLFPIKSSLATVVHSWFSTTQESHKPFLLSLALVPINIFDTTSELIGLVLQNHLRYILCAFMSFTTLLTIYNYTPTILSYSIWKLVAAFNTMLDFFISVCNIYVISLVIIGYFSLLYMYWTPENSSRFRKSSYVVWFFISLYLSNAMGAYPTLTFCGLQVLYSIGFIHEIIVLLNDPEVKARKLSLTDVFKQVLTNGEVRTSNDREMPVLLEDEFLMEENEQIEQSDKEKSTTLPPKPFLKTTGRSMSMITDVGGKALYDQPTKRVKSASDVLTNKISIADRYLLSKLRSEMKMSIDFDDTAVDTDKYMYGAMYACLLMILWKHKWIVAILIVPLAYYYLKKLNSYFGIGNMISNQFLSMTNPITSWCQERHQALIPVSIKGLYNVSIIVDQKVTHTLKGSVDAMSTTAVIVALIIFVICTMIFITVQVYTEGVHLVKVSGEILNSTLMNNPDIDWVPQQLEESVNSVLDSIYMHGRSAISNGIEKLVKDLDPVKAEHVEKKFLELWDRLYQAWMMSNDNPDLIGPTVNANVAFSAWESLKDGFGKTPLQLFNMNSIQNFVKENIGIFMSVLDSVWSIVKGNITVVLGMITELIYIVFISGSALLNFTLSTIVFFTALFYLLSSSDRVYKPIELITNLSPISCYRFAVALQESVIGVFKVTFKLASFFGMWTWFIHNLFQVKIIYLPTVFATLLGAVPFIDVSIVCIPATIELWFTQGALIALVFFLLHFSVFTWAITDFYMEIKGGGHPYLTGLSIAGGIFCLGIEGAIFGPLLLCCIMVVINLSRKYLQSPTKEAINTINSQIDNFEC
ncbi:transmembrane protein 245 isoform X2 [Copidosoma floridanum]|uniref:transmembrane protein 245 isoform X2 n=1 Tax=Copidosoma floridanum TaxID=29053 RepID=UPI0006C9B839|nr:transmembrane protein 245 isoform X2 [Copidosoma floridanum]